LLMSSGRNYYRVAGGRWRDETSLVSSRSSDALLAISADVPFPLLWHRLSDALSLDIVCSREAAERCSLIAEEDRCRRAVYNHCCASRPFVHNRRASSWFGRVLDGSRANAPSTDSTAGQLPLPVSERVPRLPAIPSPAQSGTAAPFRPRPFSGVWREPQGAPLRPDVHCPSKQSPRSVFASPEWANLSLASGRKRH
jgi:hypothetical protein